MNLLHKAYQSGSLRAITRALKKGVSHDRAKDKPYTEEDQIELMIKKNEYMGDLIKKFDLTT